tara:strand:+ start:4478 stop:4903 length:426 start_codon:yes stop_codon:yes gene_type:complete
LNGNPDIPEGFVLAEGRGAFSRHNGPLYRRVVDGRLQTGLRVLDRHCNGLGFLHGGMAAAFADSAMAWAVWDKTNQSSVTMRLSVDYLQPVRLGDWLMAESVALGVDGDIVHVKADLTRNERFPVCDAMGVFHIIRKKANS